MSSSVAAPETARSTVDSRDRLDGLDLARALAVFGMVLVNFNVVLGSGDAGPGWLRVLAGLVEGRAVAVFVVLAGVGTTLLAAAAAREGRPAGRVRGSLLRRAALLWVLGMLYSPIWPADILHYYALYIAVGVVLLRARDRVLLAAAAAFTAGFVVLLAAGDRVPLLDYERGWNFATLEYDGYWTVGGQLRNLLYNGFHPVVPWTALFLLGMWLGRRDLSDPRRRRRIVVVAAVVAAVTELASYLAMRAIPGEAELVAALFGTAPMPPMPQYIVAGGATAVAVIVVCVAVADRRGEHPALLPLLHTGQLALTLYVAHVVVGLGALIALGLLPPDATPARPSQSLVFTVIYTALFCAASVLFATLWRRRRRRGPLEQVMRKLTG